MIRPYNMATRAAPFDSLRIDDVGDVATARSTRTTRSPGSRPSSTTCCSAISSPLPWAAITIALPHLRALAEKHGPLGMMHIDAHTDINDDMFGEKIAHGTPFRRAVEGLLDGDRVVQIGVRGTGYATDDWIGVRAGLPGRTGRGVLASQP